MLYKDFLDQSKDYENYLLLISANSLFTDNNYRSNLDSTGLTPFSCSLVNNRLDIANELIRNYGHTILLSEKNLLISLYSSFLEEKNTYLHLSVKQNYHALTFNILTINTDILYYNNVYGYTAFDYAVLNKNLHLIEVLQEFCPSMQKLISNLSDNNKNLKILQSIVEIRSEFILCEYIKSGLKYYEFVCYNKDILDIAIQNSWETAIEYMVANNYIDFKLDERKSYILVKAILKNPSYKNNLESLNKIVSHQQITDNCSFGHTKDKHINLLDYFINKDLKSSAELIICNNFFQNKNENKLNLYMKELVNKFWKNCVNKLLLVGGYDYSSYLVYDGVACQPLAHHLTGCGWNEELNLIIDNNDWFNVKNSNNQLLIEVAANSSNSNITINLIKKGANYKDIKFDGKSLLHFAADRKDFKLVLFLLKNGDEYENLKVSVFQYSILEQAIYEKQKDIIHFIITDKKVNYKFCEKYLLYLCILNRYNDITQLLIDNGLEEETINSYTNAGSHSTTTYYKMCYKGNLLHAFVANGSVNELTKFLEKYQINLEHKNSLGYTPIEVAIKLNLKLCFNALLVAGSIISHISLNQMTDLYKKSLDDKDYNIAEIINTKWSVGKSTDLIAQKNIILEQTNSVNDIRISASNTLTTKDSFLTYTISDDGKEHSSFEDISDKSCNVELGGET